MKTRICVCMICILAIGWAQAVQAKKLPGPFPWGMEMAEMLQDVTADFEPVVRGDTLYLNTGYGFGGYSRAIIRFGANGLVQARYEVRPEEGEAFYAPDEFDKLLAELTAEYGPPESKTDDKRHANAAVYYWETAGETVALTAHGGRETLELAVLVYTAKAPLGELAFDYVNLPPWGMARTEVMAALAHKTVLKSDGYYMNYALGTVEGVVAELQLNFIDNALRAASVVFKYGDLNKERRADLYDRVRTSLVWRYGEPDGKDAWHLRPAYGNIFLRKAENVLAIDSIDTGFFEYHDGDYYPREALLPIYDPPPWGVSVDKIKERMAAVMPLAEDSDYLTYDIYLREGLPVQQSFHFTGGGKLWAMRVTFDIDGTDDERRLAVYHKIKARMNAKFGRPVYDFGPNEAEGYTENEWALQVGGYWRRHAIWQVADEQLLVYLEMIDDEPHKELVLDYTALDYLQYF